MSEKIGKAHRGRVGRWRTGRGRVVRSGFVGSLHSGATWCWWCPSYLPGCISFIFSLWICFEIQPAVVTPYMAVQNVWTTSLARNYQFESGFQLKRLAIYMKTTHK